METHIKNTIFLKDSVLFISKDGKEYEVSNPEAVATNKLYFIDVYPTLEWPGEVELITIAPHPECNKARECLQLTDGLNCSQAYDARIRDTSLCAKAYKVARLLPNEKKIYNPALSGYKPESDYKQFEGADPCTHPQCECKGAICIKRYEKDHRAPVESQEEPKPKIYKKVKTIDIPEIDQIMSSTPDEVRKYIKEKLNKVARVMTEDCTYEEAERNWQNDNSPLSFIEYLKKYYTITRKPE